MRRTIFAFCLLALAGGYAFGAECPGNPDALGTSRTIVVDPTEHPLIGSHNYRESLPLEDHEVVLTFDDGPLPPSTGHVLDTLASECIKATFFMVGRMAQAYPALVKRAYAEGHTIATHSESHPLTFQKMPVDKAAREIEEGFESVRTALGDPKGVSDFFRIPGLLRQDSVEQYLTSRGYQTWSVDFMADDWHHINDKEIVRRAITRIEARGRGILLLHDIHPKTALALPQIIKELKARGYKIVHVVEATPDLPKTASLPEQWIARPEAPSYWPHVDVATLALPKPQLDAPNPHNFGIADGAYPQSVPDRLHGGDREVPLPAVVLWPHGVKLVALSPSQMLPIPAADTFRYTPVWKPRSFMRSVRVPMARRSPAAASKTAMASRPAAPAGSRSTLRATRRVAPSRSTTHAAPPPPLSLRSSTLSPRSETTVAVTGSVTPSTPNPLNSPPRPPRAIGSETESGNPAAVQ
jgi:peptidoglycan/xylan/chitin deacetylase (PgdA/CDA1 family)